MGQVDVEAADQLLNGGKGRRDLIVLDLRQGRAGKTGTLAVVVIGRPEEAASDINPFYFSLLGSVCAAAAAQDYETLVSFQSEEGSFFGKYEERGQADGLIVVGTTVNEAAWSYFRELAGDDRAVAFGGSPFDDLEWVRSDNYEGGLLATHELIAAGCKDIVHIGAVDSPQQQFRERYEGYTEAMRKEGLKPSLQSVDENLDREEQGRQAIDALVDDERSFDGLFVACDSMALGALEQLHARDISVPGQCSLIGFDGIRAGQHSNPPLTSIEPDFDVAGAMLVRTALGGDGSAERRVPVRLLHGMRDESVPYELSLRIAETVESEDVQIRFVKDGDHRLSTDRDLDILSRTVAALCDAAG